ncbi:MAG: hypothetical protein FD180_1369 [Planctomycetota bacterium]|nr:MAG: hypothetical protein FD180_1369 [Planctomycetota bacterium]
MKPELKWFGAGAVLAMVLTSAVFLKTWRAEAGRGAGGAAGAGGDEGPGGKRAEGGSAEAAELQKRLEAWEASAGQAQKESADSERARVALRSDLAELKREVEQLKKELLKLAPVKARAGPPAPLTPEQVANLQKQAMDGTLDAAGRVEALQQLRKRTASGRTPEVVRSMLGLLETSADAGVRADICKQLKGVDMAEAREAMLRRLREDKDRKVREEAAETLEAWKDDAGVRAELEVAAKGDEDADVRKKAAKSLGGKK